MSETMRFGDWLRPALPLLLLRFLAREPSHGYGLVEQLRAAGIEARGTTVYPHLTKLHEAGYLDSTWHTPDAGPARKILTLTAAGHRHREELEHQWRQVREVLSSAHADTIERTAAP